MNAENSFFFSEVVCSSSMEVASRALVDANLS